MSVSFHHVMFSCTSCSDHFQPLTGKLRSVGLRLCTKILAVCQQRVPQGFRRDQEILEEGRWSWTIKLAQKRSWVGRWSWAEQVGPLLLRVVQVVRQQQRNGHCLCDCPSTAVETAIAQCTNRWAMARAGDTALTLPLFWRRSTVSPVFFGLFPRSSLHSVVPSPLCPRP